MRRFAPSRKPRNLEIKYQLDRLFLSFCGKDVVRRTQNLESGLMETNPLTNKNLGLLPAPTRLDILGGDAVIDSSLTVAYPDAIAPAVKLWLRSLETGFGVELPRAASSGNPTETDANIVFYVDPTLPPGGYRLRVDGEAATETEIPRHIGVKVADLAGAFNAVQTLQQLAGPTSYRRSFLTDDGEAWLPNCEIWDSPLLEWRGAMMDVARHFRTKADVLRFIDILAAHKLNRMQLHLTDDQGWRFEVDGFPLLTEVGGWRTETVVGDRRSGVYDGRPHGGFYSRADLREIAAYGRARGVEVVPEIDLPGHSIAAITAYPFLASDPDGEMGVRREWGISRNVLDPSVKTLEFFKIVLNQIIEDMNPLYLGLGGDEVPVTNWKKRPDIVAQAASLGYLLPDGTGDVTKLSPWFIGQLAEFVAERGIRAVVWDDCLGPELPASTIITVWHLGDVAAKAIAAGYDVVLAPFSDLYFDYVQSEMPEEPIHLGSVTTLEQVYNFEPELGKGSLSAAPDVSASDVSAPAAGVHPGRVLGAQAQLWSEFLDTIQAMDYAAFPRLSAFSEVAWTKGLPDDRSPEAPAYREFMTRLEHDHLPRLDAIGVAYRPLDGPKPWQQRPGYVSWDKKLAALTAMEEEDLHA